MGHMENKQIKKGEGIMKILVTVSTFYPLKDGVQAVTEYLTKGLVQKGHKVTVVTSQVADTPNEEDFMGIHIIRVPIRTKYGIHLGNKKGYRRLILQLTEKSDALINVCTQTAFTDFLYPILPQVKCKKILHMHGMYDFHWRKTDFASLKIFAYKAWRHIRWGWLYFVNKQKFKQYDHILQLHPFDDGYVFFKKHYGIDGVVVENAAEDQFYTPSTHTKQAYAICVSNYIPRKNQEMLLNAFYKSKAGKQMELIMIGSEVTPYYKHLQKCNDFFTQRYGPRSVKLLTHVTREKTVEYVKNASVYLMSSTWEAFSISIIEAMAAGTPFISTDVGVSRYLPGGMIVQTADEMAYWLDVLHENPDVKKSLSEAARAYYTQNLTTGSKVDLLNELIE